MMKRLWVGLKRCIGDILVGEHFGRKQDELRLQREVLKHWWEISLYLNKLGCLGQGMGRLKKYLTMIEFEKK